MKYLAIDYGEERTGIAISDAGGKMAFALTSLNRRQLPTKEQFFNALLKIIANEAPELIVVGMPLSIYTVKPSMSGFGSSGALLDLDAPADLGNLGNAGNAGNFGNLGEGNSSNFGELSSPVGPCGLGNGGKVSEKTPSTNPSVTSTTNPSTNLATNPGTSSVTREMPGAESLTCRKICNFIKKLKRRTDLPVYTVNEAYSSFEAETRLRQAGLKDKALLEKLDAESAAVILETFINLPPEQRTEDVR